MSDVSHNDLSNRDLDDLAFTDDREFLFLLNATLQPTELPLFGPVVEGRDQDHDDDREQDRSTLNPSCLAFTLILNTTRNLATGWEERATFPIISTKLTLKSISDTVRLIRGSFDTDTSDYLQKVY